MDLWTPLAHKNDNELNYIYMINMIQTHGNILMFDFDFDSTGYSVRIVI